MNLVFIFQCAAEREFKIIIKVIVKTQEHIQAKDIKNKVCANTNLKP